MIGGEIWWVDYGITDGINNNTEKEVIKST
jgi:hypothetical protein